MGSYLTSPRKILEYETKIKEYPELVACAAGPENMELDPNVLGSFSCLEMKQVPYPFHY